MLSSQFIAALSIGALLGASPAYAQTAAAGDSSIRRFTVHVPQAALNDLRRRLAATRWPHKETVADRSQGANLAETWVRRAYPKLIYFHEADKGGHFAAWVVPRGVRGAVARGVQITPLNQQPRRSS